MNKALGTLTLATVLLFAISALAADRVVVVPLGGKKPSGDAVATDVLEGKTFSNKDDVDIIGTRPPSPVAKTGQTLCYESPGTLVSCTDTGQDGELKKGVAWPVPRFIDNGNGTVTDELTGLIWLKDANCFNAAVQRNAALNYAKTFYDGYGFPVALLDCGLSDGSSAGDWRLPNRFELESLLDLSRMDPALSDGHPFVNVQSGYYWTSSYNSSYVSLGVGWAVHFSAGSVQPRSWALEPCYVWLVRSGN